MIKYLYASLKVLITLCLSFGLFFAQAIDVDKMRRSLTERFGNAPLGLFNEWRNVLQDARNGDESAMLKAVNDFFNRRIYYNEDQQIWGQVDYWATPLEVFGKGQADCEDFAFAKYFSLRELGVSNNKLRLVYVKLNSGGQSQAHMVLGYYATPESEPLILDNMIYEIRPAQRRPDLTPVFSFNADGIWVGQTQQVRGDPSSRLSRWRDLLKRVYDEGSQ